MSEAGTAVTSAEGPAGIASVNHAIAVLKALPADGAPMGVNELARRTGLHKSTVSRLLATMERHQFVQRAAEDRRVMLGIGLVALVSPLVSNLDMVRIGKPIMSALATETGETTILGLWNGREAVMVELVIGPRAVVHVAWPGKTVPAHTTAIGKVFLACLPEGATAGAMTGTLQRFTQRTLTDPAALADDLALCRARGYAVNDQENELESCGVAAPVRDFRGNVVAALSLAVPKHRFDSNSQEALAGRVVAEARKMSTQLGWSGA